MANHLAAGGLQRRGTGVGGAAKWCLAGKRRTSPTSPSSLATSAGGHQVHQEPVQPVDGLGAHADQVLAPVGQQMQHDGMVFNGNLTQPGHAAPGDRDQDRVVRIGLAAMPSDSTRTRAASLAGTSMTRSWSATRC
jgi:hypothetical protein